LVLSTTRYLCSRTEGEPPVGPDGLDIDDPDTFKRQWPR
jgi:hypothetical protein